MKPVFILAVILFCLAYVLTWIIKVISGKKNIVDHPNERSSHTVPTPRGGGLAIVLSWYAGISVLFINGSLDSRLFFSLASGIILAGVSLADDLINIKPSIRLAAQLLTATLAIYFLHGIEPLKLFGGVLLPSYIIMPVVILGVVWFINLFNFLDGIDGYASVEAISLSVIFFILTNNGINLILIAAVAGFLIWNWPKARIFMGDVGSTQLGFILAVLGVSYHNAGQVPIILWIIITMPFWFDATLTLYRRWRNKEVLSQAHRKHIYQRLVQSGFSHLQVDIFLIIVNIILGVFAFAGKLNTVLQIPFFIASILIMFLIAIYAERRKPFREK
jgi:UDP-N-acetylmuramyl pentapeptide phosphotransferase/UDP-N-acetylglucosamine-1-phosphate transferase